MISDKTLKAILEEINLTDEELYFICEFCLGYLSSIKYKSEHEKNIWNKSRKLRDLI